MEDAARRKFDLLAQAAVPVMEGLDGLVKLLIAQLAEIDRRHPGWKDREDDTLPEWSGQDARRFFFLTLRSTIMNALLSNIFFRDHLCSQDWWVDHHWTGTHPENQAEEYARSIRWLTFQQATMIMESTVRAIIRSEDTGIFSVPPAEVSRAGYYKLHKNLLEVLGLTEFQALFAVASETRNTIHNNGMYAPPDGKDKTYDYEGKTFDFEVGAGLPWFTDSVALWLIEAMATAMRQVVLAPQVSSIPFCARRP